MTKVSEEALKTSGLLMTNRMFLFFLMVTRMQFGTGFRPSFCTALRAFFSWRVWRPRPVPSSPA